MPFKGGFNRDESYTREGIENKEYQDMIVWGTVCKDAKVYHYKNKKKKNSMKVDVLMKYEGGKSGYLTVLTFKDTYVSRQLATLKRNDKVVIFGTLVKSTRYDKDEQLPITHVYLDPAFVISERSMDVIDRLANSPKFLKLIEDGFETDIDETPATDEPTEYTDESGMGFA